MASSTHSPSAGTCHPDYGKSPWPAGPARVTLDGCEYGLASHVHMVTLRKQKKLQAVWEDESNCERYLRPEIAGLL